MECGICNKSFSTLSNRNRHERNVHKTDYSRHKPAILLGLRNSYEHSTLEKPKEGALVQFDNQSESHSSVDENMDENTDRSTDTPDTNSEQSSSESQSTVLSTNSSEIQHDHSNSSLEDYSESVKMWQDLLERTYRALELPNTNVENLLGSENVLCLIKSQLQKECSSAKRIAKYLKGCSIAESLNDMYHEKLDEGWNEDMARSLVWWESKLIDDIIKGNPQVLESNLRSRFLSA